MSALKIGKDGEISVFLLMSHNESPGLKNPPFLGFGLVNGVKPIDSFIPFLLSFILSFSSFGGCV